MTDLTLLLIGSGVFFIFLVGCYVYLRENFASARAEVEHATKIRVAYPIPKAEPRLPA